MALVSVRAWQGAVGNRTYRMGVTENPAETRRTPLT